MVNVRHVDNGTSKEHRHWKELRIPSASSTREVLLCHKVSLQDSSEILTQNTGSQPFGHG